MTGERPSRTSSKGLTKVGSFPGGENRGADKAIRKNEVRDSSKAQRDKARERSPTKSRVDIPDNITVDLKNSEEWGFYYAQAEECSKFNDTAEILRSVYLASKSTKLDLADMGLEDPLPREVYTVYFLKQMMLSNNCLISISPLIGNPLLQKMMQLDLSNNCLASIPREIGLLTELQFLLLHDNHLTRAPEQLVNLTVLQRLTLNGNQLTSLPNCYCLMTWLKALDWLDNPLDYPRNIWGLHFNDQLFFSSADLQRAIAEIISDAQAFQVQEEAMAAARERLVGWLRRFHEAPTTLRLNLDDHGLQRIPPAVAAMTYLTDLSLARNRLTAIPPGIRRLGPSLTRLDLSHNLLGALPMGLRHLTNLTECGLAGMAMDYLPKEMRAVGVRNLLRFLDRLQEGAAQGRLVLDGMDLEALPEDVLLMTNLTELYLDRNRLAALPPELTVLRGLKTLSAVDNNLRTIPLEYERFDRLERINLLGNPIDELPLGLCRMSSLTELRSYSHGLVPRPPDDRISQEKVVENTFALLDSFEHMIQAFVTHSLVLVDMRLAAFPNEAFQISSLTRLDLSLNDFSAAPPLIGGLRLLRILNLAFNRLDGVTFTWDKMAALQSLRLHNNRIPGCLHPSVGALTSLTELHAHDNLLSAVPAELCRCAALEVLDLSFNEISLFPPFDLALPALRHVDLRHNRLEQVPTSALGRVTSLRFLDLSHNRITVFPPAGAWPPAPAPTGAGAPPALASAEAAWRGLPLAEMIRRHAAGEVHVLDLPPPRPGAPPALRWAKLETLRLHGNRLTVLPFALHVLTSVTELSYEPGPVLIPTQEVVIRGWGLIRCYARRWADAADRRALSLSRFGLLHVPAEVLLAGGGGGPAGPLAAGLTRLDLSHNRLRGTLEPGLSMLTALTELDVSHNLLVDLHPSILTLTRLCGPSEPAQAHPGRKSVPGKAAGVGGETGDGGTGSARPAPSGGGRELAAAVWMTADGEAVVEHGGLRWHGNRWQSPPEPVRTSGTRAIFAYLRRMLAARQTCRLNLTGMGLRHVPYETLALAGLTSLDLRWNRLRCAPPALTALRALASLNLDHNRIALLHPDLCRLGRLTALSARHNDLVALPHELCAIPSLTALSYSGNVLSMPPEGSLVSLDALPDQRPPLFALNDASSAGGDGGPARWMREILSSGRAPEASLIYLRNFLAARGSDLLPATAAVLLGSNPAVSRGQSAASDAYGDSSRPSGDGPDSHPMGGTSTVVDGAASRTAARAGDGRGGVLAGTGDLDLRALGLSELPREVRDLVWGGREQRCADRMTSIFRIRLDNNPLPELAPTPRPGAPPPSGGFNGWWGVRELSVCNCLLRGLPAGLADPTRLPRLESLDASDNAIRNVPAPADGWPSLRRLRLDRNDLVALPAGLGYMTALESLSVRQNALVAVPASIWRLQHLRELLLEENQLDRLCPELGVLVAAFPHPEEVEAAEHRRRGGPELDYVLRPPGSAVPELPPDDPNALGGGAFRLLMGASPLGDIHAVYGCLTRLEVLGNPGLWSPPPEVVEQGTLCIMRYLRALFDARHTHSLDLHDFGLFRLPPEVLELGQGLRALYLSFNELESLPVCVEELAGLRTLHLHHNRLDRLPPNIGLSLNDLTDLDITGNCLARIPLEFANLVKLSRFETRDNPWEMVPDEMIGKGTAPMLLYLLNMRDSVHGVLDLQSMGLTTFALTHVRRGLPRPELVHTVHLEDNVVRLIPRPFKVLTNVTNLSLDRNKLKDLPIWLPTWKGLRRLSISHNLVQMVQPTVGKCYTLEKLLLDNNFLTNVPNTFAGLTCLRLLVLNPAITFCYMLQRLWLTLNELTMLPPELCYCTALTDLRLDGNSLKSPPREILIGGRKQILIGGCKNILNYLGRLQAGKEKLSLDLSGLNLVKRRIFLLGDMLLLTSRCAAPAPIERDKAVIVGGGKWAYALFPEDHRRTPYWDDPPDPIRPVGPTDGKATHSIADHPVHLLGNLVNLQSLSVRNNFIKDLPGKCFPRFQTCLKELFLDNNQITILPFEMNTLDELESFSVVGNDVKHPPVDYEKEGFPTLRKYWKRIMAASQTGICELPNLTLSVFPPEFAEQPDLAHNIRYLDLSNNRIQMIPSIVEHMTRIETLKMDGNQLVEVPEGLFGCTSLMELSFDRNGIDLISPAVRQCTRLTYLSLRHNRLETVPDELGALTNLVRLGLSHNKLKLGTAWWLARLTNLQSLGLEHNRMIAIPVTVGVLTKLEELLVFGNPLRDPPRSVLAGGLPAIRDYLQYNVKYESDQSSLAPPRLREWARQDTVAVPALVDAALYCRATASSTYNVHYGIERALDGGADPRAFWRSQDRVDDVLVEVDLGTRFSLQRVELHWRSCFSPRRYSLEVSEEGRQWFRVHRCIVDPALGEGDAPPGGEEHMTVAHGGAGMDRTDVVWLRREQGLAVMSSLPSSGMRFLRLHMTARWYNSYRLNQLRAYGDRIEGASAVGLKGREITVSFKDA